MTEHDKNLPALVEPPIRSSAAVHHSIAVFDENAFSQMLKVARMLALAPTTPETLRGTRERDKFTPHDEQEAVANCFIIVNQARGWGMNPFAVAQSCSVVRGKLMHEGKLIAAVLEANLGVELEYEYIPAEPSKPQSLGIIVSAAKNNQPLVNSKGLRLEIRGSVANWHTGDKGPWNSPENWERQLAYRGAREWARRFRPAVLLGIIGDDEIEEMRDEARLTAPMQPAMKRLEGAQPAGPGLDMAAHIARETGPKDQPETAKESAKGPTAPDAEKEGRAATGVMDGSAATDRSAPTDSPAQGAPPKAKKAKGAAKQPEQAEAATEQPQGQEQAGTDDTPDGDISPDWLADLSEDQLACYDRVFAGLKRVESSKQWIPFKSAYASEMKEIVTGMPEGARLNIESAIQRKREEVGL